MRVLSLKECRDLAPELRGRPDEEVERVLATMNAVAGVALEALEREPLGGTNQPPPSTFESLAARLPEDLRERARERAAMREYLGRQERDTAERGALAEVLGRPLR